MLKVILWYLGSEWANLVRLIHPRPDRKVFYFAFGANLDDSVLSERKIRVFDAFDHALPDAALQFTQSGFYEQHGYASADYQAGSIVYGRVYQILETDARRMDYFEGEAVLKVHEKVYAETGDIRFYYYRTTRIHEGLKPTQEYLDYLLNAYQEMDIVPDSYIEHMKKTAVLTELKPVTTTTTFVSDLENWPKSLHPVLLAYERSLQRFIAFTWHRSLVQWAIR